MRITILAFSTVALMIALGLTGCTDPAAFIQAAGTRSACLHVTGVWGDVDAWTMNQNNSTIEVPCKGNQGMNIAPTPPTVIIMGGPGQAAQVIR